MHELWKEIGALGDGVELHKKEMLALSLEDEKEINKLMKYVSMAETMTVPVEKPFDAMNLIDYMKLGMSMKAMGKVMKEYGNMDINELAMRFKHPLIQRAIIL